MIRTISRTAVGGWISLVRWPLDSGVRLLGDSHLASRVELALDRLDATARELAGRALRDEDLMEHGARLRAASRKRDHALSLREEADRRSHKADDRIADQERHAERQRRDAARRAADRKKQAERERQAETHRLTVVEAQRKAAAKKAAAEKKSSLDHRAKEGRLEQLDEEVDALAKRERALVAKQEAQRLSREAGKAKSERKSN
jgi:hypothetical protein